MDPKRVLEAIIPKRHRDRLRQAYLRLTSFLYIGNRFICPCCNGHFGKLRSFGIERRPNAQCPRCGSLERHRLLWLYLKNRTGLFRDNLRLLHFAPEPVFEKAFRAMPNLHYFGVDLDSPLAATKVDVMDIQYEDDTFDAILCGHVLEHVTDDRKAMRELFRVLKPGGWAIPHSPMDTNRAQTFEDASIVSPEARERAFGQRDHVRMYGRDYKGRLEEAGFTVSVHRYLDELGAQVVKQHGLPEGQDIYFCTKPEAGGD